MEILGLLRKVLTGSQRASRQDHARSVDEHQQSSQAKAWERKGGPVDPGFSA